jgi:hypothetical protein
MSAYHLLTPVYRRSLRPFISSRPAVNSFARTTSRTRTPQTSIRSVSFDEQQDRDTTARNMNESLKDVEERRQTRTEEAQGRCNANYGVVVSAKTFDQRQHIALVIKRRSTYILCGYERACFDGRPIRLRRRDPLGLERLDDLAVQLKTSEARGQPFFFPILWA